MKQPNNIVLKKLLKKTIVSPSSELENIIGFYKTILELERSKEPDIATYYPYELHFKDNDSNVILIDMPCNVNFTKAFEDNRKVKFPKDLYVGIAVSLKDKTESIVAFSVTVNYEDLNGFDPYENLLPIKISNLTLESRHISSIGLEDESKIEEIDSELSQINSIGDLRKLVKSYFGDSVELKQELQLGLSSKNIALSQIASELNKFNSQLVEMNDLLKHFLIHSEFDNQIEQVSVDELVPVSMLDESQASVVAHALSNRFSVVTGAPGTGKTQVILNIIANALLKDKSVLVASKINKAVDNVKERFDVIDSSQYLLRFGNKEYVRHQTVPALTQILNRINVLHNQQEDSSSLSSVLSQYEQAISSRKDAEKKLARIEELKISLPQLISEKSTLEAQIHDEQQVHTESLDTIKNKYSNMSDLGNISMNSVSNVLKEVTRLRNDFQLKYSGLRGKWNNMFSKKKHAKSLLNEIENLPHSVNTRLKNNTGFYSVNDFENGNAIIEYANQVIALLNQISHWRHTIEREECRYSSTISKLNLSLSFAKQKYDTAASEFEALNAKKGEFKNLIKRTKDLLFYLGPQLVAAKIVEIEKDQGVAQRIASYMSYLPDNIPWRDYEIPDFIQRSKGFLSVCRLISVTSLSVKSGFPLTDNLFDLLIIDEASQCDVASALPLILRAKQVVIIGDPMQLRHITSVNIDEENEIREHFGLSSRQHLQYVNQSLWDYSAAFLCKANKNSSPIMLENHYRCHHDIIGYSNHQFYSSTPLIPLTDESKMTLPQKGIVMINIKGRQESDNVNINRIEAERAVSLAKELLTLKADVTIGIVTPFRDQADYINSLMDDFMKEIIEVNTAYGFQGDERDVMIYSTVVTDNSPKGKIYWIDTIAPNLVNVAVTRARQTLYIVGNAEYIKAMSPERNALGYLIRYAQSKTK